MDEPAQSRTSVEDAPSVSLQRLVRRESPHVFVNIYWQGAGKTAFEIKGQYPINKLLAVAKFSKDCIESALKEQTEAPNEGAKPQPR